ncbi:DNA-directed RNA polymerase subunit F [Candidatus Micrarchaeota archaeon]|nr:DNA-directed RNA polymerase subunit F [Candidatus Micrarchaeota archaeon]
MELVKNEPITLAEVVALLKKRQADGELSYEQQNALDYAEKFSKVDVKAAKELMKELAKINGLGEKSAACVTIINILPKKEEEAKAILSKDKVELPEESLKEIIKIIKKYRK